MRPVLPLALILFALIPFAGPLAQAEDAPSGASCRAMSFDGAGYTVCTVDVRTADLRLFHSRPDGTPWYQFAALETALAERGERLVFAMNGGMYHADRAPVGLLIIAGETLAPLVRGDGPGNFQLLPNGVFWLEDGRAGVTETETYAAAGLAPDHATQSGPMLVIDGALHPAFRQASESRYRRNGVGVSADGETVHFAISERPVSLHRFARLFRDGLGTPNALYLDGKISRLHAPQAGRREFGLPLGPIVGVVAPATEAE